MSPEVRQIRDSRIFFRLSRRMKLIIYQEKQTDRFHTTYSAIIQKPRLKISDAARPFASV